MYRQRGTARTRHWAALLRADSDGGGALLLGLAEHLDGQHRAPRRQVDDPSRLDRCLLLERDNHPPACIAVDRGDLEEFSSEVVANGVVRSGELDEFAGAALHVQARRPLLPLVRPV